MKLIIKIRRIIYPILLNLRMGRIHSSTLQSRSTFRRRLVYIYEFYNWFEHSVTVSEISRVQVRSSRLLFIVCYSTFYTRLDYIFQANLREITSSNVNRQLPGGGETLITFIAKWPVFSAEHVSNILPFCTFSARKWSDISHFSPTFQCLSILYHSTHRQAKYKTAKQTIQVSLFWWILLLNVILGRLLFLWSGYLIGLAGTYSFIYFILIGHPRHSRPSDPLCLFGSMVTRMEVILYNIAVQNKSTT